MNRTTPFGVEKRERERKKSIRKLKQKRNRKVAIAKA